MKIMDINGQDDCCVDTIIPVKKKKMKQAQLPFQTRSPTHLPSVIQSKKRKLTSPSVDCKSSKTVKISKTNSKKVIADTKLEDSIEESENESNECVNIVEDIETENLKENAASNKVENENKKRTSQRNSIGQKTLEKNDKMKSSPLTKFLKKADKEVESSKDHSNSLEDKEDESVDKSLDSTLEKSVSQTESNLKSNMEDTSLLADNSLCCNSDSDIEILSSDNENKEEQIKSDENVGESTQTDNQESCKTPKRDKIKPKKLTPKQREKEILSAKKREERKKQRMEKEKKMEEEKQNRQKEKEEKRRLKEKEKAEKEQKMEQRKMKKLQKQMELEQKQKEKQAKEEERKKKEEAKEEEKRKKEEEKLEAKRKKQKAASNFTSFFVAKKQEKSVEGESTTEVKNFMPFEVKADMKIAPVTRRTLSEQEKLLLDKECNEGNTQKSNMYLSDIKDKKIIPRKSSKTWPLEAKNDVILLDDENDGSSNIVNQNIVIEKHRIKLLQFSENQRPPYWGTWRKRSKNINSRRPFAKDTKWFSYEVDSDEEWEEEEPGESLHGSDDEKDEENPEDNEYDVDNEFMVPHGYLSDEELRADEEDKEDMSPETQKFKLKLLSEQFELERKVKTSKLRPKIIGCVWRGPENTFSNNLSQRAIDFLKAHEAWISQIPVQLSTAPENEGASISESGTPATQQTPLSSKKTQVPKEALPDLIRLIHGNTYSRKFLVREFMTYWNSKNKGGETQISKVSLVQKIRAVGKWMACPDEGPMHLKACWYVPEKVRKEYVEEDLPLPNRWSYVGTIPKRKNEMLEVTEKLDKEDKDKDKKNVPLITQFTKRITQEEMKKQLNVKAGQTMSPSKKLVQAKPPKRVTLISVPRGEQFSKASKDSLFKSFLTNDKTVNKDSTKDVDNIIILDDNEEKEVNEGGKSDEIKSEDRLDVVPIECKTESETEKSSMNTEQDKHNAKSKSKTLDAAAKGTVDNLMDIDSD